MTPRKHKHADMIRRWLDDASLEVEWKDGSIWMRIQPDAITWDEECEYRFKPKMIRCGDMEFPEPMRVAPDTDVLCWVVDIGQRSVVYQAMWDASEYNLILLKRGFVHLTKSAAEAHARALIALTEVK